MAKSTRSKSNPQSQLRHCSFCNRDERTVNQLIIAPESAFICDECVGACRDILAQGHPLEMFVRPDVPEKRALTPKDITNHMSEWVIGQTDAKRVLSVAVYNHYKRINNPSAGYIELEKSNILLIGPTGCGKTLLAQTLARVLDVPFCIADATSITQAGYVGEDVENILLRLIQAADYDVNRAARGIVYIDEIDKIARKGGDSPSLTRDVSGEGVQQALLKLMEGTVANVPPQGGRKHPHQDFLQLDTRNVLFICGGTFAGLEDVIAKRVGAHKTLGFTTQADGSIADRDYAALLQNVAPEDLVRYGMIPEFMGRLPIMTSIAPLDVAALSRILTEPRNAIVKQFEHLLSYDGVNLVFTDDAIQTAAAEALRRETGARGLRAIVEGVLMDVMYEVPSRSDVKRVIVNADAILHRTRPILENEQGQSLGWGNDSALEQAAA